MRASRTPQGAPRLTVLDRDALDRVDQPCCLCRGNIGLRQAPDAVDILARKKLYAHGFCALRREYMVREWKLGNTPAGVPE